MIPMQPPEVPSTPPEPQPAPVEDRPLSSEEKVVAWRYLELLKAGYGVEDARLIALRGDIDLHEACALTLEKKCPVRTAVDILL